MTDHEITVDVRLLLRDHVETYEQLEILRLFAGTGDAALTPDAAATAAGLRPEAAVEALGHLERTGVLDRSGSTSEPAYRARPDKAQSIDALGESYRHDRLMIMNLMTAHALDRVRTSALRAFAQAFLVGRRRDG